MRKLILILTLLVFSISCAVAEGVEPATTDMPTITMIGGADGPTDITISEASDAEESTTIGIIGGVDGPTVMIGGADGSDDSARSHAAHMLDQADLFRRGAEKES